jgi:hypothetical protein
MTKNNTMHKPEEIQGQSHIVDNYRRAFVLTLIAFIAVAGLAAWLWWRSPFNPITRGGQSSVAPSAGSEMSQPTAEPTVNAAGSTALTSDTPVAPIQLSPQRMQSIGVKIGTVESKVISDEIRSYGNVQANERRFAYVQTRFAGWIRKIYADATGDFIAKGQPLFTIYSPDLVASEREYLLAKKSAAALQQSAVNGVADGAASLITASMARLQQFDISESEIAKLDDTGEPITELTVNSPVAGHITPSCTQSLISRKFGYSPKSFRTMRGRSSQMIQPTSLLMPTLDKYSGGKWTTCCRNWTWRQGHCPCGLSSRIQA